MKFLISMCALLVILSPAFADAVTFTTSTTIGCDTTRYEGYDVTINGCAITVACQHSFNSLRLINGATLTHAAGDTIGIYLTIAHNVVVDTASRINVVGRGYSPRTGPGAGQTTDAYGSGGGHAGIGGISTSVSTGGAAYGSIGTPLELGSGGGASGGYGGGIIHLVVGDTLRVVGALWANGGNCTNTAGAGGGGSICLTAGVLAGTGQITALGGAAQSTGGGGGGGRIALYYATKTLTGTISVCGGVGFQYGGPGTYYTKSSSQTLGDLLLSNCTISSSGNTPISNLPLCNVLITSRAVAILSDSVISVAGNLHIAGTGQLLTAVGQRAQVTVQGNAVIDSNGTFSAVGCGYAASSGPGAGPSAGDYGGGGGYGGAGGGGNGVGGGTTYAVIAAPENLGSGGGGLFGAAGGGALHLMVSETLRVDGVLSVNGDVAASLSGGGAGGSLYLEVAVLAGRGSITTQGGQAGANGGGGGGGCLALYYGSNLFTGTLSTCGGWGYHYGGAGMLYTKATSQTVGELAINNCAHAGAISGLVTPPVCNVTITSGGVGECEDSVITFNGNLHVTGMGQLLAAAGRPLQMTVTGNLRIDSLGLFSALGRGYAPGTGPGAGATYGTYGGGGGYGGAGGTGTGGATGGGTYGNPAQPLFMGSGGGASAGAAGGGAVMLTVNDTLFLNDSLIADGGQSGAYGGGGSGGSVYLRAHVLVGNGYISANGGNGNVGGGGGGGGRVAIYACSRTLSTSHITASGGSSQHPGFVGTVYLGTADCNQNGIPDGCDLMNGTSTDCNGDGIPDECQTITAPVVTVNYTDAGQLLLRWTCVPGYSLYRVYGRHGNGAEVELTTTGDLGYDASSLLNSTSPQSWTFRVVGMTP